jgi:hypothetical protein
MLFLEGEVLYCEIFARLTFSALANHTIGTLAYLVQKLVFYLKKLSRANSVVALMFALRLVAKFETIERGLIDKLGILAKQRTLRHRFSNLVHAFRP